MASRLLRRSGIAVVLISELLEWKPTKIVQVGIGRYRKEVEVFKEAWPGVELIGFDPMPSLDLSDYPGRVVRTALGREEGSGDLRYDSGHPDGASLYSGRIDGKTDTAGTMVCIETLDAHCYVILEKDQTSPEFAGPPFVAPCHVLLWLDCEGSELDVLKGGERFVEDVEMINVELTGKPPRVGWPSPATVNRWLIDRGFLLQFIHTHRSTSGQFDAIYVRPHLFRPEHCSSPFQVEEWEKRTRVE